MHRFWDRLKPEAEAEKRISLGIDCSPDEMGIGRAFGDGHRVLVIMMW